LADKIQCACSGFRTAGGTMTGSIWMVATSAIPGVAAYLGLRPTLQAT